MPDACHSCKAPLRWAVTERGRMIPLDVEPVADGNIRLAAAEVRGGWPRAAVVPEERRGELDGELYVSHFVTCPYADEHRRRR